MRSGEELARVRQLAASDSRDALAFTPDGQRVLIRAGNSVRLWPVDIAATATERKPRELTAAGTAAICSGLG